MFSLLLASEREKPRTEAPVALRSSRSMFPLAFTKFTEAWMETPAQTGTA